MIENLKKFRNWILGFGVLGVTIWTIIKVVICATCGFCIL